MTTPVHITQINSDPATIRSDADLGQAGIDSTNWHWFFVDNPKANIFYNMPNFSEDSGTGTQTNLDGSYDKFTVYDDTDGLLVAKYIRHLSDTDTRIEFTDSEDEIVHTVGGVEFLRMTEDTTDLLKMFEDRVVIDDTSQETTIEGTFTIAYELHTSDQTTNFITGSSGNFSIFQNYGTSGNMTILATSRSNSSVRINSSASSGADVIAGRTLMTGDTTDGIRFTPSSPTTAFALLEVIGNTEAFFIHSAADIHLRSGDGSGAEVFLDGSSGFVGICEDSPITLLEITDNAPYITLHNDTEENTDGGRESRIIARGEKADTTEHVLGYIEFSHDGGSDDQKGQIEFFVNDGNDGTTPSKSGLRISYDGAVYVGSGNAVFLTGGVDFGVSGSHSFVADFLNTGDNAYIRIADEDTTTHIVSKDNCSSIGQYSTHSGNVVISSAGHVGIMLTEPDTALHIGDGNGYGYGCITLDEQSAAPPVPDQDTQCRIFCRDNKLIVSYNQEGTTNYKYLSLTGSTTTWTWTTSAP